MISWCAQPLWQELPDSVCFPADPPAFGLLSFGLMGGFVYLRGNRQRLQEDHESVSSEIETDGCDRLRPSPRGQSSVDNGNVACDGGNAITQVIVLFLKLGFRWCHLFKSNSVAESALVHSPQ